MSETGCGLRATEQFGRGSRSGGEGGDGEGEREAAMPRARSHRPAREMRTGQEHAGLVGGSLRLFRMRELWALSRTAPDRVPVRLAGRKTVGEPRVRRNPERSRRTKRPRCSGIETRRLADGEAIPTPPRPGTASRHSSGSIVTLKPRSVGRAGVVLAPALVPPQTEASCPTGAEAAPLDRPGRGIPDRVRVVALAGTQHWPVTAARPVVSPTPGPRQAGRLARAWRLEG
jgi:hypothetical protein